MQRVRTGKEDARLSGPHLGPEKKSFKSAIHTADEPS